MGFEKINMVRDYEFYIDLAFSKANKRGRSLKLKGAPLERKKKVETAKISTVKDTLDKQLSAIVKSFPAINDLTDFYKDLVRIAIGLGDLKKSLGAINWARKKVLFFYHKYAAQIRKTDSMKSAGDYRNQFYGRVNSILKQVKKDFVFLEKARKELKKFPTVKSRLFTVAIAGFPNVGKSTLLKKLTNASPEVASYAFTTRGIMMGTLKYNSKKIQIIDTPGTLNRFNKMNDIEKQAWLALKHVADLIIYVFDLTEMYQLKEQKLLLRKIKRFDKPVLLYLSKTDLIDKEKISKFNLTSYADVKKLKKEIIKKAEKNPI